MYLKLDKSAQMEMIGLVIIVILISLGMLFMAQFAFKEQPEKNIFTRKGLAYSTMTAITKTTLNEADCPEFFMFGGKPKIGEDLLKECAEDFPPSIYNFGRRTCDGMHSCDFLNETISKLLNQTLGSWYKKYQYSSTLLLYDGSSLNLVEISNSEKGCPATKDRDSSNVFQLETNAGRVESILYLCD